MVSKKILTLILIFSTVGILFSASALAEITTNKESKVHEKVLESFEKDNKDEVKVIVQMEETSKVQANSIRSQAIDAVGKGNVRHTFSSFNGFSATVTEEELENLRQQQNVARVSYDHPIQAHLTDSVPLINASTTWNLQPEGTNLTGKDQTVCVIDSGVDYNHSDLGGEWGNKVIAGYRSLENENDQQNCSENHSACMDDYGHGTHVAGIVAADGDVKGVARGANIAAVKAMNETGSGYSSDIMYGVEWCTNESERLNISTMTLSLGLINSTTDEEILHETYCDGEEDYGALKEPIDQAVGKNITVSIATGNAGNETAVGVPACMENATRVGATDDDDNIADWTNGGSNNGGSNRWDREMLVAPGTSINSTNSTEIGGEYDEASGTSMSTPHVSGAVAIMNQYLNASGREENVSYIENALNDTGKLIEDTEAGRNFSRIDAYSSVVSTDNEDPEVNLISPEDGTKTSEENITFNCNASDLSLKNATFYLWNKTSGEVNETIKFSDSISGSNEEINPEITGLQKGDYKWNCEFEDENGNKAMAEKNYTLKVGVPDYISITPKQAEVLPERNTTYNATAYYSEGDDTEEEDITDAVNWSIREDEDNHNGTWYNNTYKSNVSGTWTVEANYTTFGESFNNSTSLKVAILVNNITELQAMNESKSECFALNDSINAGEGVQDWDGSFEPVGNETHPFNGTLDGQGYLIHELNITDNENTGLFGYAENAEIRNVGLENVNITGGNSTGGIIGHSQGSLLRNSFVSGNTSGENQTGSLVGYSNETEILNTYGMGSIEGDKKVGGLIGFMKNGSLENSYSTVNVSGNSTRGLIGGNESIDVNNSYWNTETTGLGEDGQARNVTEMTYPYEINTTYEGWDFNSSWRKGTWKEDQNGTSGYPSLMWEKPPKNINVTNVHGLQAIKFYLQGNYSLQEDINASETETWNNGKGFKPMGDWGNTEDDINPFRGILNGNGNEINNLYINRDDGVAALFVAVGNFSGDGEVKNISLKNVDIHGNDSASGLAGINAGELSHCHTYGSVTSGVNGTSGLVLLSLDLGEVSNSSFTGSVTGEKNSAGLVQDNFGVIKSSYTNSSIEGENPGGLVAMNGGNITHSYSTSDVTGNVSGGLVATNLNGTINRSYARGTVDGELAAGGLVGINQGSGENDAVITDSYAMGNVTGINITGGLVGGNINSSIINRSYSTGFVQDVEHSGALVGTVDSYENETSHINYSYANNETTGQDKITGTIVNESYTNNETSGMLNTSQMTNYSSGYPDYEGWGFAYNDSTDNVWENVSWVMDHEGNRGYPALSWQEIERIDIQPDESTLITGEKENYTAWALNKDGIKTSEVTKEVNWSIEETNHEGNWTGEYNNTYESNNNGTWEVNATWEYEGGNLTDNATLHVIEPDYLEISPANEAMVVGETVSYSAIAHGNNPDKEKNVTPDTGWSKNSSIGNWSDNTYTSDEYGTLLITGNYTSSNGAVTLYNDTVLDVNGHHLEVNWNDDAGSVDIDPDRNEYNHEEEVSLEVDPEVGWFFDKWTGDTDDTDSKSISITMDGNKTVEANFIEGTVLTIDIDGGGSTDPSKGEHTYKYDETVNIEAESDSDWEFLKWTGDDAVDDPDSADTDIDMEDSDKDITADFNYTGGDDDGSEGGAKPANVDVDTLSAEDVTDEKAVLRGEVTSLENVDEVDVYFEWWEEGEEDGEEETDEITVDEEDEEFETEISGLNYDTEYVFQAVADWDDGSDTGNEENFTTERYGPEISNPWPGDGAEDIATDINLTVEVEHPHGYDMDVTFYDSEDEVIGEVVSADDGEVSVLWEGLEHNETYEWYVTVEEEWKSTTGGEWSFTTAPEEFVGEIEEEVEEMEGKIKELEESIEDRKEGENASAVEEDYKEIEKLIGEARTALEEGDYGTAESKLEEVETLYPEIEKEVDGEGFPWTWAGVGLLGIVIVIVLIYLFLPLGKEEGHGGGNYTYKSPQEESLAEKLKPSFWSLGGGSEGYTYRAEEGGFFSRKIKALKKKIKKWRNKKKQKKYDEF